MECGYISRTVLSTWQVLTLSQNNPTNQVFRSLIPILLLGPLRLQEEVGFRDECSCVIHLRKLTPQIWKQTLMLPIYGESGNQKDAQNWRLA